LWFLLFFVGPLLVLVAFSFYSFRSLEWVPDVSFTNYTEALTSPVFRAILTRTMTVALSVTAATLLIAYPFTYIISFVFPARRQLLYFLVLVTLFGSYLVRIYAWRTILGAEGVINGSLLEVGLIDEPLRFLLNSPVAVGIALTNFLIPLAVLPIYSSMQNVSPGLLEAGRDLGAGPLSLARRVVLPLTLPGVRVAAAFTFIAAAADFATPALLGGASGRMAGGAIVHEFGTTLNWPLGAALALTLILILVSVVAVMWWLLGRLAR
jgi:spermidine/putrescine transport system permease protein